MLLPPNPRIPISATSQTPKQGTTPSYTSAREVPRPRSEYLRRQDPRTDVGPPPSILSKATSRWPGPPGTGFYPVLLDPSSPAGEATSPTNLRTPLSLNVQDLPLTRFQKVAPKAGVNPANLIKPIAVRSILVSLTDVLRVLSCLGLSFRGPRREQGPPKMTMMVVMATMTKTTTQSPVRQCCPRQLFGP